MQRIKTKYSLKIIASILIITFISCKHDTKVNEFFNSKKEEPLFGLWKNDRGMVIEVIKEGESFKAKIIEINEEYETMGFKKGQLKWRNIKKLDSTRYELDELFITIGGYDDGRQNYIFTNLEIINDEHLKTYNDKSSNIDEEYLIRHWYRMNTVNKD
jgi:hypothetical protein